MGQAQPIQTVSIEIFKAGERVSTDGIKYNITAKEVADCASCYDKSIHEAPLVIGHPQTDDPAWGWVSALKADGGGSLNANFSEVDPVFTAMFRAGRYKKISSSFYPPAHPSNPVPGKWYLRHVGALGAVPPAVKGQAAANFSEADGCVEFSESIESTDFAEYVEERATGLFRKMRDWMIGKFGLEEADRVIPNWELESMNQSITAEKVEKSMKEGGGLLNPAFSESNEPQPQPNPESQPTPDKENPEMTVPTEQEKDAIARADAAVAELNQLKAANAAAAVAASYQSSADFAESLVKSGKLQPAHKGLITQTLALIQHPDNSTADFGEGDNKKPLSDALREFLAGAQVKPIFGEHATGDKSGVSSVHTHGSADFAEAEPERLSHHQRATALVAKEGISYEEAARRTVA